MAEQSSGESSQTVQSIPVSISASLDIPEDHPLLFANTVNITGSGTEVFLDFFLLDAHLEQGTVRGKAHFVARVGMSRNAAETLSKMLQDVFGGVAGQPGG